MCLVTLSGGGLDEKQLYDLAYNTVEPQIDRINGVASANVGGGQTREIEVKVKRDALRARSLAILDVVDAVRQSNLLLPSGHLKAGQRDYNVFSNTQVAKARPLSEVIVRGGTPTGGSAPGVQKSIWPGGRNRSAESGPLGHPLLIHAVPPGITTAL